MKIFSLAAIVGAAAAFTDERQPDVQHPDEGLTVDLVNSTKLVGLIGWNLIVPPVVDPILPDPVTCKDEPEGCDKADDGTGGDGSGGDGTGGDGTGGDGTGGDGTGGDGTGGDGSGGDGSGGDGSGDGDEDPDAENLNEYACAYRIKLLQPFQIISDDRFLLYVGHNCPEEIVDTFSFNFRLGGLAGTELTLHEATQAADEDDAAVVQTDALVRKQAGVTVDDDESAILFPLSFNQDGNGDISYAYTYTPGTWLQ